MEIVTSNGMIRRFRTINEFTMDLGFAKTVDAKKEGTKGPGQIVIKIRDPFVKRYSVLTGSYLIKSGCIGSLDFYTDNRLGENEFIIYDQDKEYKFTYDGRSEIRSYLSDKLDKILSEEAQAKELEMNMEEKIEFKLDKNLSQTEFLQKQKEMESEMARFNVNMNKK